MTAVRRCPEHGYVAGLECDCGRRTEEFTSADETERVSRFLSGLLRHFPGEHGIDVDDHGWADADAVAALLAERYDVPGAALEAVVRTDENGRYELVDGRVRALYGHSGDLGVEVSIEGEVPDVLYHGTAARNLESIRAEGLDPRSRSHVHLTDELGEAVRVGRRHGSDVAVLSVRTPDLAERQAVEPRTDHTFVTDAVPPEFLRRVPDDRLPTDG